MDLKMSKVMSPKNLEKRPRKEKENPTRESANRPRQRPHQLEKMQSAPQEDSQHAHAQKQVDEEQELEPITKDIDCLSKFGITATDIKKFKEAGYLTVKSVQFACDKHLLNVKGITDKKLADVKTACCKVYDIGFRTGTECLISRQGIKRITTGVKDVDKLLGGGIETGCITELYGEFRTGKTQLCHTLCVTAMLPVDGFNGGEGKVCYIDTEGSFRPEKIGPIAERFGVEPSDILDNLVHCRAMTSDHQMSCFREVGAIMREDGPFALIIVDSMTSLLRVDYVGRGELSSRQQLLGQMLSTLIKIGTEYNVAIVITNQVMSNPDGGMTFVSDPKKAVGGHVLAHASAWRCETKKGRGDCRILKIVDSPTMPEGEATFQLSEKGCCDAES